MFHATRLRLDVTGSGTKMIEEHHQVPTVP